MLINHSIRKDSLDNMLIFMAIFYYIMIISDQVIKNLDIKERFYIYDTLYV